MTLDVLHKECRRIFRGQFFVVKVFGREGIRNAAYDDARGAKRAGNWVLTLEFGFLPVS